MISQDFSQRHIHRFNGIGRVDRFPNIVREGKEREHSLPVIQPGFTNGGIVLVPDLCEFEQFLFRFRFRHRTIDFFQVAGDCFPVFIGDIREGIPHHMYDTKLNLGLGKHGFIELRSAKGVRIGKTRQAITAGDKDVLNPTILQFC